jgi:hypothetical protein
MKATKRLPLYAALLGSLLPLQAMMSEAAEPQGPYTYCINYPDDPVCTGKPEAPAAESVAVEATAGNLVLLFASEDCSGSPTRINASTPQLAGGTARSFAVESGLPASAWQKAEYSGAKTELVGPSICVSPGWEIASIRLQGQ